MSIKIKNSKLIESLPYIVSLGTARMSDCTIDKKTKFRYNILKFKNLCKSAVETYEESKSELFKQEELITVVKENDDGSKVLQLNDEGLKHLMALFNLEIEIESNKIKVPMTILAEDYLTVTLIDSNGNPKMINENIITIIEMLEDLIELEE